MTDGVSGEDVPSLFLTRFPSCAVVRSLACTEGAAVITGLAAQAGRSCGGWGWCPADSGGRSASSPPLGHYEPGAQREPRRRDGAPTRELPERRPRAGPIAPTRSVWDAGATGRPCPPALANPTLRRPSPPPGGMPFARREPTRPPPGGMPFARRDALREKGCPSQGGSRQRPSSRRDSAILPAGRNPATTTPRAPARENESACPTSGRDRTQRGLPDAELPRPSGFGT
jgi:hypothetical protein